MNIRIAVIFIVGCIAGTISARTVVTIKNEYRKPIVLQWVGKSSPDTLQKGDSLSFWLTENLKTSTIKVEGSLIWHKGLQREIEKISNTAKTNPNITATIRILDTNNPTNFEYNTNTVPNSPEFMLQYKEINAQQYIDTILQGKNPAYNQTDINFLKNMKENYDVLVRNIDRVLFNDGVNYFDPKPIKGTTREEKIKSLSDRLHPWTTVLARAGYIPTQECQSQGEACIIQQIKKLIQWQSNVFQDYQSRKRWTVPS